MSSKKLKIAIISCGGTITMEPGIKGALEPKKSIGEVLNGVNLSTVSKNIDIPVYLQVELFKYDSTDLNSEHWLQIINTVEKLQDKCDGIIILHGTDTMSYSATAVGLALCQKIKIPVIFTGSQSPIHETGSDGKINLERSLLVIQQAAKDKVAECMIFFGDAAYRSVTSRKRSESDFYAFESPSVSPLYRIGGLGVTPVLKPRTQKDVEYSKNIGITLQSEFAAGVVMLSIIPGLEADILLTIANRQTTKAIILNSLGAGNIPAFPGPFNLIPVIKTITKELHKPVIIASPFIGGTTNMDVYLPGLLAKEAGSINVGKMTSEATVVKTRLLLGQANFDHRSLHRLLTLDFAGETAPTGQVLS